MFKKIKENKKGFTLAELLIVVAIIGVLVAVSIPIFTAQLKKARLSTNQANARAAYAAAVAAYLQDDTVGGGVYDAGTGTFSSGSNTVTGNSASGTNISAWTVDSAGSLTEKTFNSWGVTLNVSTGEISAYTYGE